MARILLGLFYKGNNRGQGVLLSAGKARSGGCQRVSCSGATHPWLLEAWLELMATAQSSAGTFCSQGSCFGFHPSVLLHSSVEAVVFVLVRDWLRTHVAAAVQGLAPRLSAGKMLCKDQQAALPPWCGRRAPTNQLQGGRHSLHPALRSSLLEWAGRAGLPHCRPALLEAHLGRS